MRSPIASQRLHSLPVIGIMVVAVSAGSPAAAIAQDRPALAARAVSSDISVDGRLDEPAWAQATPATDFRQLEPSEGTPSSQQSEVRVLYGPGSLYVGALLRDAEASAIEAALGRRDDFNRADWFFVSLDAYLDRRTAYTFGVNAAGVQYDAVQSGGGGGPGGGFGGGGGPGLPGHDESWDAIWAAEVRTTPEGWVAEIEIPYSMLRFPRAEAQTWGIHFSRHIPRLGEEAEWPLVPRAERANRVARFADLTGMVGIEPQRNVQLRPYSLARLQTRESLEEPGSTHGAGEIDVGGDLKLGFGPNVTLDATVNPDFGQVESDPAVLNLTAFETIFEERRPFFLEGSQIYEFSAGPGGLLYTRRIGAIDPIIAAAKLSGRTGRGLSFGVLGATTGADFDPTRQFGVARATQQLGASTAGGIITLFDGPAFDSGRARSLATGADWDLRFRDSRYGVEGFAALTHRSWTADGVESETGFAGKVWGRKRQGPWQGFLGAEVFSDDFDPNDVGQLRFNNAYVLIGSLEHEINESRPFGPFQRASAGLFGVQRFTYADRLDQGLDLDLSFAGTLRGFQTVEGSIGVERAFGGYDIFETRGAGPWAAPPTLRIAGEVGTDQRRSWQVEPELELGFQDGGGRAYTLGLRGEWSVSDRLALGGNVEGGWEHDFLAWSSNETFMYASGGWWIGVESGAPLGPDQADYVRVPDDDLLDDILLGVQSIGPDRWFVPVFGARDTRAADLTLRGTYTFSPGLSLQLYGQLFAAEGRYDSMGILRAPDDLTAFDPFPKRDEFAFSRLQSNAVLRWEYRPGSTLYAVWTHGRQRDDVLSPLAPWGPSPFDRSLGEQLGDTFATFPENVFLVKVSYTFLNR